MASIQITESEILDALAASSATPAPKEYRTLTEIVKATKGVVGERTVRKALQQYHADGRLVTMRVAHQGIDGRRSSIPAYAILPVKQKR